MRVIADANELFSAVIAKGKGYKSKTLGVFFLDDIKLSSPYRLLAELENNREEIRSKSEFSHEDFNVFIEVLFSTKNSTFSVEEGAVFCIP